MRKYLPILCLLPLVAGYAHAADSTITITGYLKDNACSVSVDSQDFTVDLLSNAAKQFKQVGAVTSAIPFKIVFDKCGSSATAVRVGYVGTSDSDNTTLLKIDAGTNAASGIGVQILDRDKTPIPLNAAQDSLKWTTLTAGQSNTLGFYARLMATRAPVMAGTVTATANFTLEFQ
ncbi:MULTISPECIES: fimbrial protein [Enterobacterales]|uniref:S-fimbrial protein subunit SfaG n=1 Tax=Klebsiella pasteurii TaxID=2587529 RepID=A0A9Q9UML7_9ENTR|nr:MULTISPECIES: fimbrial protein [Enterobacterales]MDD9664285.1 fimbrial protein [Klebsiella pasteurii]MDD9669736.1 fimbrial protein [Klebsiella pasteurii]MDD9685914.1 fimbrial protein [Klebsiella pasteurii]MDM4221546.1 fimbrial protein [Klebsiella pasteurii]MDS7872720.1 fimbrial protein [Klebsiella pasteurii]